MAKQILVTGGAGYIGSACVQALVEQGHSVVVFDDLSHGQREKVASEATLVVGDLTDRSAITAVCEQYTFDAVFHFAAKKAVGESEEKPAEYFHNNVTGSLNLLAAMTAAGIPQLVFSSTAAVYAPPVDQDHFTEASPVGPVNVYGRTKLMVEDAIQEFARLGQLQQYTIFRYFNVAGDAGLHYQEANAQNVFPILGHALTNDAPFHIFGTDYDTPDGTCVRDYIHLSDLVDGHLGALESNASGIYNLGSGTGYSVRELVAAFEAASGKTLAVTEAPRRAGDPAVVTAKADKAHTDFGWKPKCTLEDMINSSLVHYR